MSKRPSLRYQTTARSGRYRYIEAPTRIAILLCSMILIFGGSLFAADNEALQKQLNQHAARSASTWTGFSGRAIGERIVPAPDVILDYLLKDNQVQGYTEVPKRPDVDPAFLSDIVNAVTEMPASVREHFAQHVVAIFLVKELGGTAYTELLRDVDANKQGFIVLDVGSLSRKANEWFAWKANSPFTTKGAYKIEAEIERQANDTRKSAIQYILLHEMGHLMGVVTGAHPSWIAGGDPQQWPFTRLSWLTLEKGFDGKSKFEKTFTNRRKLKFYAFNDAALTADQIDETYGQLLETDFVSLYAATNMYDDFAETYAMYVHLVLQKLPWKIRIIKEGKTVRALENPILEKRCEDKRKYLDKIFSSSLTGVGVPRVFLPAPEKLGPKCA